MMTYVLNEIDLEWNDTPEGDTKNFKSRSVSLLSLEAFKFQLSRPGIIKYKQRLK